MSFCQKSSKFYEKINEKIVDFVKGYPYDFLLKITKIVHEKIDQFRKMFDQNETSMSP